MSVLQDVFPTISFEKLQFGLQECQTVDAAAAFLLRDNGLEGQSDYEGEFDSASFNSTGQFFYNRMKDSRCGMSRDSETTFNIKICGLTCDN